MKKILIYGITLLMTVSLGGCKDYLETKPFSNTVVDNFYKDANDAERALTGCYNALVAATAQGGWFRGSFNLCIEALMDAGSDECLASGLGSDPLLTPTAIGNYTARDEIFNNVWSVMYKGVNRVNYLLEKVEGLDMDNKTRKAEIIAEARFLRGVFYFYLSNFFGGVPYYDTSVQDPLAPRNDLQTVYGHMLEDFQHAYEVLPNRPLNSGCAHKWSAAGFLVKTWCYLASCKMNNVGGDITGSPEQKALLDFSWVDAPDFYKKAYELSEVIIGQSGFKLTKYYDRLFRETCATEQYEECLFTAESTDIQGLGNDYLALIFYHIPCGPGQLGGGYGNYRPVGECWKRYNQLDIRRAHNLAGGLEEKEELREEINGVLYYKPNTAAPSSMSFNIAKFRYREASTKKISSALSEGNFPVLRFADILLMNAEATYFHLGDENKARERLSQVRERVSSEQLGSTSEAPSLRFLNNTYRRADFLEELLEERSRELCYEAQRRSDLIRFGRFFSTVASLSDGKDPNAEYYWNIMVPTLQQNLNGAAHKVWFPLPINDVILNENLIQNPGYESR